MTEMGLVLVVLSVLGVIIIAVAPRVAERLVRFCACRLTHALAIRMAEEWSAELDAIPSRIGKLASVCIDVVTGPVKISGTFRQIVCTEAPLTLWMDGKEVFTLDDRPLRILTLDQKTQPLNDVEIRVTGSAWASCRADRTKPLTPVREIPVIPGNLIAKP